MDAPTVQLGMKYRAGYRKKKALKHKPSGSWERALFYSPCGETDLAVAVILDDLFGVANFFLYLAFDLLFQAFGLLLAVADYLASLFLNFAADVLERALGLIFVHVVLLEFLMVVRSQAVATKGIYTVARYSSVRCITQPATLSLSCR